MKKFIITISILSLLLFGGSVVGCIVWGRKLWLALAITFGTVFYHFSMRLAVGLTVNAIKRNNFDYRKSWFQERRFERKLFRLIRIKKWKGLLPTFSPQDFDLERHSLEKIVQATCQSEVVHEIIFVLSFLPILFSIWFGEFWVFFFTSLGGAFIDLLFVLLQRYNRPRLLKLLHRTSSNA